MNDLVWYSWLGGVIIGTMVGANMVLDEVSRAGPRNVVITGRYLSHSKFYFTAKISNISIFSFGLHLLACKQFSKFPILASSFLLQRKGHTL